MNSKKLINFSVLIVLYFIQFAAIEAFGKTIYFEDNIHSPVRVCTDNLGNIYFTDSFKHHACLMDSTGNILLKIPGLGIPMAIAIDQNQNIFVSDRADSAVKIFDHNGNQIKLLGTTNDEFRLPSDIEIDNNGNIYVVDSKDNCVKVYTSQWNFSKKFGEDILHYPTGIAIDDNNGEIIIGQNNQDTEGQIFVFTKDGELVRQFGVFGKGEGRFTRIQGITLDTEGRLYVCDAFQSIVQVLDRFGNYIETIGHYGTGEKQLQVPLDAAFLDSDRLVVTSYNSSRITVYHLDYKFRTQTSLSTSQDNVIPENSALLQNYPNPCNPSTWIPYKLHDAGKVTIKIYNILGNRIRKYELGHQHAGEYLSADLALYWDGKNEQGIEVPSGIYIYQIDAKDFTAFNKLIIMK